MGQKFDGDKVIISHYGHIFEEVNGRHYLGGYNCLNSDSYRTTMQSAVAT